MSLHLDIERQRSLLWSRKSPLFASVESASVSILQHYRRSPRRNEEDVTALLVRSPPRALLERERDQRTAIYFLRPNGGASSSSFTGNFLSRRLNFFTPLRTLRNNVNTPLFVGAAAAVVVVVVTVEQSNEKPRFGHTLFSTWQCMRYLVL